MPDYNITDELGTALVRAARNIAAEFIKTGKRMELDENTKKALSLDYGIFVTVNISGELRGCIGFPLPRSLDAALPEAAIAAATQDPRFSPVTAGELDRITFEVTVLTPPSELRVGPVNLPSAIKVGRHGLIVRQGSRSGLLLPQVPVEYGWSEEEFLSRTCQKAGLPDDCWKEKDTQVFSFDGIVFREEAPNGKISRHNF